jgi:Rad3-related DNA helicase
MDDHDLIGRIDNLVAEEHGLRERAEGQGLAENDKDRLQKIEVALDQCWDLLRQRRALRHKGDDPDSAEVRDPGTVEGYRQ